MNNEQKNKEKLKEVLETLRAEKYPQLPAELVAAVIDIQSLDGKNTHSTYKKIEGELLKYVNCYYDDAKN